MGNLVSQVRKAGKAGNYIYATLEALNLSRATVVITGSKQRLTNLEVMSSFLIVGERVIVDYSGGSPPFVRGTGTEIIYEERYLDVNDGAVSEPIIVEEITASICSLFSQDITKNSEMTIDFETTVEDVLGAK